MGAGATSWHGCEPAAGAGGAVGADAAELRRARRRFVRDHHPDRGGDPAAFARGLAAFDRGAHPAEVVTIHRRPGVPMLLVRRLSRRWRRRRHPRVT